MTNRFLPRGGSPFNQGGPPLPEWRRFFESLASTTDDASLQASLNALAARVSVLESEGSTDIGSVFGTDSIVQVGTLQSGNVFLSLQGDVSIPGSSYYYGTDAAGVKGWHVLPDPPPVSDSAVPYFVPDGESYTVFENKQALFTIPIDLGVGSSLVVDGILVEVD